MANSDVPSPPFSTTEYPLEHITATSGNQWAEALLGCEGWTLDPIEGGTFNPSDQCVDSVDPPSTKGLLTVLVRGLSTDVNCVSYICIGGPGAGDVDAAIYPESTVGGAKYLGWNGSSFVNAPSVNCGGYYWYRLDVQWEKPYADPNAVFYAKNYRHKSSSPPDPFKVWAFKHIFQEQVDDTVVNKGNITLLYEKASEGPFLRAQLVSDAGRGILRITYSWMYSALNCDPSDTSEFLWDFIKKPNGKMVLSPVDSYQAKTLYVSVRDDWDYYVQVQAPHSADWITEVGRDEEIEIINTGILGVALKGFNEKYIAVKQIADTLNNHSGYRLQSFMTQLVDDCVFIISKAKVLQSDLSFLSGYEVTSDDIIAVVDAYGLPSMTAEQISQLVNAFPVITPELLESQKRSTESENSSFRTLEEIDSSVPLTVGAVVCGIIGGAIGFAVGGPMGAAGGIALGLAIGAPIGFSTSVNLPHEDTTNTVNPNNPTIAQTLQVIQPTGGPYENRHLWEDLFRLTNFPHIGDAKLPDAACMYPPANGNKIQLWYPTRGAIGNFIHDEKKYTGLFSPVGILSMAIFIIIQLRGEDGRFQMRLHPDMALLNTADRPNHSQLTQGSRILALAGDDSMHVYAAGEIYVTQDDYIKGVNAKTGHYFNRTETFDQDVFATTKKMLQALGYSVENILCGDDFWTSIMG